MSGREFRIVAGGNGGHAKRYWAKRHGEDWTTRPEHALKFDSHARAELWLPHIVAPRSNASPALAPPRVEEVCGGMA